MSAELVGSVSLGALCPTVEAAIVPVEAQLEASLTGALAIQASAGVEFPTLVAQGAAVAEVELAIDAGIAAGLPGVSFSIATAAALVAAARLALGNLEALVELLGGPAGGVFVYKFSGGTVSSLGSDISAGVAGSPPPGLTPSSPVSGILIGAAPPGWAEASPFFGGL